MSLTDERIKRTRDECQHELKLTGMYEPLSVACKKCGSLHFSEDEFDAQQAKIDKRLTEGVTK